MPSDSRTARPATSRAGSSRAAPTPRSNTTGRRRQQARLGELGDGERAQPGGHEDQDDTRDREELAAGRCGRPFGRCAQPMPTATARPASDATSRRQDVAGARADGEEEEHRLEALADDRDEREADERVGRPDRRASSDARLELALHRPALATHPEQHPGQDADRDTGGQLLRWSPARRAAAGRRSGPRGRRPRSDSPTAATTPWQTLGSASARPILTR